LNPAGKGEESGVRQQSSLSLLPAAAERRTGMLWLLHICNYSWAALLKHHYPQPTSERGRTGGEDG